MTSPPPPSQDPSPDPEGVEVTPVRPDAVIPAPTGADDAPDEGPDLGALLGGGEGGLDFGALLEQASQMQSQMAEAQQEAAEQVVEGVAGGGVVRVEVTGGMEFRSVTISAEAVDPEDVEMLQDLVLAALHDAVERVHTLQAGTMGALDLGGLDLGGLLGGDG